MDEQQTILSHRPRLTRRRVRGLRMLLALAEVERAAPELLPELQGPSRWQHRQDLSSVMEFCRDAIAWDTARHAEVKGA